MHEFLKEYLTYLKLERNLSENTVNSYQNDLTKLFAYLSQKKVSDLSEVNYSLLSGFFAQDEIRTFSSATVYRYICSIKGSAERAISPNIELFTGTSLN